MNQPSRDTAAGAAYNELRDLAREQGRPTDELFQLYVLERFLARLAVSEHRDKLVLKGGALLAAYDLRRQTRDIDVQASGVENAEDTVPRLIAEVAGTSLADDDGIEFQTESISASTIRDGDRYAGVRVRLAATLARARLTLHIDVSFGDSIVPPAEEILYPSLRGEPFAIKGYRISTVVAEKAVSMFWLADTPVYTDSPDVLATAHLRDDGVLIVLGSWSDEDEVVNLDALGIAGPLRARAPAVEGLQSGGEVDLGAVRVTAGQGLFVRVERVGAGG